MGQEAESNNARKYIELAMAMLLLLFVYIFSRRMPPLGTAADSKEEKQRTVVIDPGHGGKIGRASCRERVYVLV